jgi:hypothetical protein
MDVNQLKSLMEKLPLVSAIFLDVEMLKRLVNVFNPEHVKALDDYYKFLESQNELTIFDKERHDIIVNKINKDKSFEIIKTGIGFTKLSSN